MAVSIFSAGASQAKRQLGLTASVKSPQATRVTGYRADIDGLRAVAIVLVVLSHMGIKRFAGGFVGVDIFFVISGYLLTGHIAQSIADGTFSVATFYERRVRRIVPALVTMLLATSLIAYLFLPSKALVIFAASLLASLYSYSNFYFFTQPDDYFSPTFTKLLLHTWSLGVEEQFYLVLPLCMLWTAKRSRDAVRRVVLLLGAVSFACAAYLTITDRTLAFYMPYTRAWELLLGSALALRIVDLPASRLLREGVAALCLLLIFGCLLLYSASTPFPGLTALPPCMAAALIIMIGEKGGTTVTAWLSWRPAVFIGVISYSLYLWHWPVILFLRLGIVPDYSAIHALAVLMLVLSIMLATISWRFVEQPFRSGRWKSMPRLRIFQIAGFSAAIISGIAITFIVGRGIPERYPGNADLVGNYLFHDSTRKSPSCFVESNFTKFNANICLASSSTKANVLLFGDSHANALWFGLSRSLPQANVMQATASSCPPVIGRYDRSACSMLRHYVYNEFLPTHHVDAVILTEAWSSLADLNALEPALKWFREHRLRTIVVGPVPEYAGALPLLLATGQRWHLPLLAEHRLLSRMGTLDFNIAARLKGRSGVRYASLWRAICRQDHCDEYADSSRAIPMLLDGSHIGDEGARRAVERMLAAGEIQI